MDPFTIAAIAAPVVGGVLGNALSQGDAGRSGDAYRAALAELTGISIPELEKLNLDQLVNAGTFSPQTETAVNLGPSAMEGIALNPEVRARQMDALKMFSDRALQGLTPADKAMMSIATENALGQANAQNKAVAQQMMSAGKWGSGADVFSRLMNNQNAAQMANQQGLQQAIASQQAKMQAARDMANTGSQIRGQEFGEKSQVAQAQDLINRINQQNSQSVQQRNVANQNQYGYANQQNAQRISDTNVGLRNQEQMYNKNLPQQNFQNQMQRAGAIAGQQNNMGNYYGNQAAQTQAMWSGIGKGVGGAFMGYNQMQNANNLNKAQTNYWNTMANNRVPLDLGFDMGYNDYLMSNGERTA